MAREEVLEFENTAGSVHVFGGGDTGNRRFMHVYQFGDLIEYQGFHGFWAVIEEGLLFVDDTASHLEQGVIAAQEAFQEPAGFLQIVF